MLSQIYNVDFLFWAVIEVKGIFFISLKYSAFGDLYIVFLCLHGQIKLKVRLVLRKFYPEDLYVCQTTLLSKLCTQLLKMRELDPILTTLVRTRK